MIKNSIIFFQISLVYESDENTKIFFHTKRGENFDKQACKDIIGSNKYFSNTETIMLESDIRIIEGSEESYVKAQKVSLDFGGELLYLYSSEDKNFSDLLQTKILDCFLDKLQQKSAYKDFSRGLESLNAFLASWEIEKK